MCHCEGGGMGTDGQNWNDVEDENPKEERW